MGTNSTTKTSNVGMHQLFLDNLRLINYRRNLSGVSSRNPVGFFTKKYQNELMIKKKLAGLKTLRQNLNKRSGLQLTKIVHIESIRQFIFSKIRSSRNSEMNRLNRLKLCPKKSFAALPLYGRLY